MKRLLLLVTAGLSTLLSSPGYAAEGGWADKIIIDPSSSTILFVWQDGGAPLTQRVPFRDIAAVQRALPYESQIEELQIETVDGQRLLVSLGRKTGGHAALVSSVVGQSVSLVPGAKAKHTAPPHADDDHGPVLVLGSATSPLATSPLSQTLVGDDSALGSLAEGVSTETVFDAPPGFIGRDDGNGTLDRTAIELAIQGKMSTFRNCYQRQLQRTPNLGGGRVTAQFIIGEDGIVERARVQSTTLNNASVEQCLIQNLEGTQFALPRNGTVVVSYPFSFTRS